MKKKWFLTLALLPVFHLTAVEFEYRVMPLAEIFKGQPAAMAKIGDLMVKEPSAQFTRTDMDAADYEEALNRLAGEGWELVTVNKSNYWIFRRPASVEGATNEAPE
ncbi:MAG: hypothetical protein WA771_14350 [Chthoniobacterales bacterium]